MKREKRQQKARKKLCQFQQQAKQIEQVILELNLNQNEEGFELAKSIINDIETAGMTAIGNSLRQIIQLFFSRYVQMIVSFIGAIIGALLGDWVAYKWGIKEVVGVGIGIGIGIIVLFGFNICVDGDESEKSYKLRILNNMDYEKYKELLKYDQKCVADELDITKFVQ